MSPGYQDPSALLSIPSRNRELPIYQDCRNNNDDEYLQPSYVADKQIKIV